jgi:hypothetical protein
MSKMEEIYYLLIGVYLAVSIAEFDARHASCPAEAISIGGGIAIVESCPCDGGTERADLSSIPASTFSRVAYGSNYLAPRCVPFKRATLA